MLNIKKTKTPTGLIVELSGTIEENVNFEVLIGDFTGELTVKCKEISRINSVGVKTWLHYFRGLKSHRKSFKFTECSPPLVEQLNQILNFSCGGEVESLLLPFQCSKCQTEFVAICSTSELKANKLQVPKVTCEKPVCSAEFDGDPKEYFYFLE